MAMLTNCNVLSGHLDSDRLSGAEDVSRGVAANNWISSERGWSCPNQPNAQAPNIRSVDIIMGGAAIWSVDADITEVQAAVRVRGKLNLPKKDVLGIKFCREVAVGFDGWRYRFGKLDSDGTFELKP